MVFNLPLVRGLLVKRYKRFLADVFLLNGVPDENQFHWPEKQMAYVKDFLNQNKPFDQVLDGNECLENGLIFTTVHCPNPGAMLGITKPGSKILCSKSSNQKRKLPYTWEMVYGDDNWIGVNTFNPNKIVEGALVEKNIDLAWEFPHFKREVKYGSNSRVDFLLNDDLKNICFLEVKNVHLVRGNMVAEFPDCVTARGTKHLYELSAQKKLGHRCAIVYIIQRPDIKYFKVADDLDPDYANACKDAFDNGVEFYAYSCKMTNNSIEIFNKIPVI